ncbi:MAG TPA: chemotaxis protein CheW [Longimicrobium sp.]|nr:chemotaxis protein CheW [Longimicrobium sp.]
MEVLVFEVAGERYALALAAVREVVRAVAVSRLPGAPAAVQGVIGVRGALVAVLDLRARFGLPAKPVDPAEHFVIAHDGARTVALRADRVAGIERVDPAEVADPRAEVPGAPYVSGAARTAEGLVLVHDLAAFLDAGEAAALDAALAAEGGAP